MRAIAAWRSGAPDEELGEHRVVVGRDFVALVDADVVADAIAGRRAEGLEDSGAREVALGRVLGVDAALDRVAVKGDLRLRERQRLAGGDRELQRDEVDVGDELGDAVLDLEAGVHLEEVEVAGRRRAGTRRCRR